MDGNAVWYVYYAHLLDTDVSDLYTHLEIIKGAAMLTKQQLQAAMKKKRGKAAKRSPASSGGVKMAAKLRKKDPDGYLTPEESDANIKGFISTGLPPLDVAITGSVGKGFPVGRVVEMIGNPDVGKTTLGCYVMKQVQKKGGIAVLIDTEKTLTEERIRNIGLDASAMVVMNDTVIESILNRIKDLLEDLGNEIGVIFWDTIAGTQSTHDKGRKIGETRIGAHASALSAGLRMLVPMLAESNTLLLCCNQRKQGAIAKMFAKERELDAALGGDALKFHSTTRLHVSYVRAFKDPRRKSADGFVAVAKPLKNKIISAKLVAQLLFDTSMQVAEFSKALSCLFTLRTWGAAQSGRFVYTDIDKKRYTEAKFCDAYVSSSGFRHEIHGALEAAHAALSKGG